MNQTLVIGSTVVDVFLSLPALPRRGDDVNIEASKLRIGGCAYNVYKTLRLFNSPALLCSPVGTGLYGNIVKEHFKAEGLLPIADLEEENGCCYCLIEPDGERTFLSHHGVEYLFSRSWMKNVDFSQASGVYISGLELEESTGVELINFVYDHPELELYFSPGPRIMYIPVERIERILFRRDRNGKGPLIHLNEKEAFYISVRGKAEDAAEYLAGKTGNIVIITLAELGCYCLKEAGTKGSFVPGFPAKVVDTVGAGDAHIGALIACLKEGMELEEACLRANKIGSAVVGIRGAVLDKLPDLIGNPQ